jgi:hypothetical protein
MPRLHCKWHWHQDRPRKGRGDQESANSNRTEDYRKIPGHIRLIWVAGIAILPELRPGNMYLFVIMEYLTRWVVVAPLPIIDSETLASVMLVEVLFKFGTPNRLIADNGSNLTSDVMNALAKALQMRHSMTSLKHPQSDRLVERMNRTIMRALAAYVEGDPSTWDDKPPFMTFAIARPKQASIKMSPFEAMFGRKPVIPKWQT